MKDFEEALKFVLAREGGFVKDPSDPGGVTNFGITQTTYDRWREAKRLHWRSVRYIDDREVFNIYLTNYWERGQCDKLKWPLSLAHFDSTVQHGIAPLLLQRALDVQQDGVIGPKTLAKANEGDPGRWAYLLLLERVWYYDSLDERNPALTKFLTGNWLKRLKHLYDEIRNAHE